MQARSRGFVVVQQSENRKQHYVQIAPEYHYCVTPERRASARPAADGLGMTVAPTLSPLIIGTGGGVGSSPGSSASVLASRAAPVSPSAAAAAAVAPPSMDTMMHSFHHMGLDDFYDRLTSDDARPKAPSQLPVQVC
jgi:hypothetical protein